MLTDSESFGFPRFSDVFPTMSTAGEGWSRTRLDNFFYIKYHKIYWASELLRYDVGKLHLLLQLYNSALFISAFLELHINTS